MALRTIIMQDNDILRKKCKPVKTFDHNLAILLDDMYDTMIAANGCGIAAPQVGILKQVIIVDANEQKLELINPIITKQSGSQIGVEGCLSVKNINGDVERPYQITVTGFDRYGNEMTITCCDFLARALCHEIDHLNGILFIDKMIKGSDRKYVKAAK